MNISNMLSVFTLFFSGLSTAYATYIAGSADLESEVLSAVDGMWHQVRKANLEGVTDNMSDDVNTMMETAFDGNTGLDIVINSELVTVLSDKSAVYIAGTAYTQSDAEGNVIPAVGNYAITLILEKRDGHWQNIQTYRSFPSAS